MAGHMWVLSNSPADCTGHMPVPRGISETPGALSAPAPGGGQPRAAQSWGTELPSRSDSQLGLPTGLPIPALAPGGCSLEAEGQPGLGAQPAPKSSLP